MREIYEPKFVEKLFDNMSSSYAKMNYITSFGFSNRWRRKCVEELGIENGKTVVDLMSGMGECWKYISKNRDSKSTLIGLDFSTELVKRAEKKILIYKECNIEILRENVFENSIEEESADYVISGFGLKTFNDDQLEKLAFEIARILKPSGNFSLIDVSVSENNLLNIIYMFYLKNVIPVLGELFLGSPETYKMLGIYTQEFGNSKNVFFKKSKFRSALS